MRFLILSIFIIAFFTLSCTKNDESTCKKACEKGIHLVQKQIDEDFSKASPDVLAEVKIFWKSKRGQLEKAMKDCVFRCMRSDPDTVSCMNRASNFDEYLKCLK